MRITNRSRSGRVSRLVRRALNSWGLLAVLAGALTLTFVVLAGVRVFGEDARNADFGPQRIAEQATLAFLDVNYQDMRPRIQQVLDLSTGAFHDEYAAAEVNLVAAAEQGQAVSTGSVKQVGLIEATADTARVLVAAESTVTNSAIEQARASGEEIDGRRTYRFELGLTLVEGRWLVSELGFVA